MVPNRTVQTMVLRITLPASTPTHLTAKSALSSCLFERDIALSNISFWSFLFSDQKRNKNPVALLAISVKNSGVKNADIISPFHQYLLRYHQYLF